MDEDDSQCTYDSDESSVLEDIGFDCTDGTDLQNFVADDVDAFEEMNNFQLLKHHEKVGEWTDVIYERSKPGLLGGGNSHMGDEHKKEWTAILSDKKRFGLDTLEKLHPLASLDKDEVANDSVCWEVDEDKDAAKDERKKKK